MLKNGLLGLLCCLGSLPALACDVCGCAVGGAAYGVLPFFQQHFMGLRYQSRTFESRHLRSDPQPSYEHFQTADVWGRAQWSKRWQTLAFIPYQVFQKEEKGARSIGQGLGDVSMLTQFQALNSEGRWSHTLLLGTGVKLPTGKSDDRKADGTLINPNLQMGSGSIDGLLSLNYLLKNGQNGLFLEVNTRLTTANKRGYRAGHRAASALKYVRWVSMGRHVILPTVGVFAEWLGRDTGAGPDVGDNSGRAVFGSLGVDAYFQKMTIGLGWQQPVYQHMGDGLIVAGSRWSVALTYLF